MKTLQVPSQIMGARTLLDGSCSLTIHTQELSDEDKLILFGLVGKFGWTLFKEDEKDFSADEVPKQKANYETETPSQRFRNVLYVYWKQHKEKEHPIFNAYYEMTLNHYIEQIKSKLE